jgi:hypothetical protein
MLEFGVRTTEFGSSSNLVTAKALGLAILHRRRAAWPLCPLFCQKETFEGALVRAAGGPAYPYSNSLRRQCEGYHQA